LLFYLRGPVVTPYRIYFFLTLAALFWGGTFVAGRQLAPLLDPLPSAFLRFLFASILLLGWLLADQRRFPAATPRQLLALTLLGLTGVFAYNLFFFAGLHSVEAGRASLIIAINPVLIALASRWFFHEHLGPVRGLGIIVSVVGAVVVIGRGDLTMLLDSGVGTGEWYLLGCVLSWVAYTLIGKRVLHGMPPLTAVCYSSVIGMLLLGWMTLMRGGVPVEALTDPRVWLNLSYLALFGTVLAFVWFYKGVHALGPTRAGQFINLVPVAGVCLGAVFLDEPLTWSVVLGGALVLSGLSLTNRPRVSSRDVPEQG